MLSLRYDMHIHSCLSPCADADMTPATIAGMAKLMDYDIVALSDHNSCLNTPAFVEAASSYDMCALPGMELTTAEEAHILVLFASVASALAFSDMVYERIPDFPVDPRIYNEQRVMSADDGVLRLVPKLLTTATDIGTYDIAKLAREYGGFAIPAHVDRSSFSLISNLGFLDPMMGFSVVETTRSCDFEAFKDEHPDLSDCAVISNSDAHSLAAMQEPDKTLLCRARTPEAVLEAIMAL